MQWLLISIKDQAIDAFQPPHSVRAKGEAIRNFMDAVNDPQNKTLHAHPEQFSLYQVGHFDDHTGNLTNGVQPELLAQALDLKTIV